jgi:hypothetical protein
MSQHLVDWLNEQAVLEAATPQTKDGEPIATGTVASFIQHLVAQIGRDPLSFYNEDTGDLVFASGLQVHVQDTKWRDTGGIIMDDSATMQIT